MNEPGRPGAAADRAAPVYDYVLAVGPHRSGTTFLYRALAAHPGFRAPEIKEAYEVHIVGKVLWKVTRA